LLLLQRQLLLLLLLHQKTLRPTRKPTRKPERLGTPCRSHHITHMPVRPHSLHQNKPKPPLTGHVRHAGV
jgi:hypothetical protein